MHSPLATPGMIAGLGATVLGAGAVHAVAAG